MNENKSYMLNIFDVLRGSFADGPGIRTVVFFKGCNLRCKWCHNPESQRSEPQLMFFEKLCTHCGRCMAACPSGLLECTLCGRCAGVCGSGARKISGYTVHADSLYETILRDKPFYEATNGGVTFSGGECMLQPDGLYRLAMHCRNAGINTAIDTAGNVPQSSLEKLLPVTDLILYDLKCMDGDTHHKYTGADNTLILSNLRFLLKTVPEKVILRIPVIPGVNTTPGETAKLREFFRENNPPLKTELMPYHRLGEEKYAALRLKTPSFRIPGDDEMNIIREAVSAGVHG